jgi:hypothetical protein
LLKEMATNANTEASKSQKYDCYWRKLLFHLNASRHTVIPDNIKTSSCFYLFPSLSTTSTLLNSSNQQL